MYTTQSAQEGAGNAGIVPRENDVCNNSTCNTKQRRYDTTLLNAHKLSSLFSDMPQDAQQLKS